MHIHAEVTRKFLAEFLPQIREASSDEEIKLMPMTFSQIHPTSQDEAENDIAERQPTPACFFASAIKTDSKPVSEIGHMI